MCSRTLMVCISHALPQEVQSHQCPQSSRRMAVYVSSAEVRSVLMFVFVLRTPSGGIKQLLAFHLDTQCEQYREDRRLSVVVVHSIQRQRDGLRSKRTEYLRYIRGSDRWTKVRAELCLDMMQSLHGTSRTSRTHIQLGIVVQMSSYSGINHSAEGVTTRFLDGCGCPRQWHSLGNNLPRQCSDGYWGCYCYCGRQRKPSPLCIFTLCAADDVPGSEQ